MKIAQYLNNASLIFLLAWMPHASAANEPLEDDVVVHRTVDGRVILTSTSPIGACLARAKIYMDELLPHADALAGLHINVAELSAVYQYQLGESEPAVARWHGWAPGEGNISIFNDFCRLSSADQRQAIAHEFGHAVDAIRMPARRSAASDKQRPWAERPQEIAASAWAKQIIELTNGGVK
jgi:hypothetical protein